jgi:hypothetical protein
MLLLLGFVGACLPQAQPTGTAEPAIVLEIRVFDGTRELTQDATVKLYPAGRRDEPASAPVPRAGRRLTFEVAPGLYDAQVTHQGRNEALSIRWAERLAVMRYPDEEGEHLEVINFKSGFGALQLRPAPGQPAPLEIAAFRVGDHSSPVSTGIKGGSYLLLVLEAGRYDILTRTATGSAWWPSFDIPSDRTRMKLVP